jgi:4'-phosphopantetheinyl transferase
MQSRGVEVWTAQPDGLGCGGCAELSALLDVQERERAAALKFDADRRAFVVAHAMRRMALGMALAVDPSELRFGTGAHGRPTLLGVASPPTFSLSRSRTLVALAISHDGPVGVDVEAIGAMPDADVLATYMDVQDPVAPAGAEGFYVQWTALEAFWKALGLGLSAAHPKISLDPLGDECFDVLYGGGESSGLVVMRLPCAHGHVLSLACDGLTDVRMVALDSLAAKPQADPQKAFATCKNGHCAGAATPSIFFS